MGLGVRPVQYNEPLMRVIAFVLSRARRKAHCHSNLDANRNTWRPTPSNSYSSSLVTIAMAAALAAAMVAALATRLVDSVPMQR